MGASGGQQCRRESQQEAEVDSWGLISIIDRWLCEGIADEQESFPLSRAKGDVDRALVLHNASALP